MAEKVENKLWVTLNYAQGLDAVEILRDGNFLVDVPDEDILQIDICVRHLTEPSNE